MAISQRAALLCCVGAFATCDAEPGTSAVEATIRASSSAQRTEALLEVEGEARLRMRPGPYTVLADITPLEMVYPRLQLDRDTIVDLDDGAHWAHVPILRLGDRGLALLVHPRHARFVSLRGSATDAAGNRVDQTIIRAYALAE